MIGSVASASEPAPAVKRHGVATHQSQIFDENGRWRSTLENHAGDFIDVMRFTLDDVQRLSQRPSAYEEPDTSRVLTSYGHFLYGSGDTRQSADVFKQIAEYASMPELRRDALRMLGQLSLYTNAKPRLAVQYYTSMLEVQEAGFKDSSPVSRSIWLAEAYSKRSAAYQQLEEFDNAIADRDALLSLDLIESDRYLRAYAHVENARDLVNLGRNGEAFESFGSAIDSIERGENHSTSVSVSYSVDHLRREQIRALDLPKDSFEYASLLMHHIDTADDPATLGVLISRYELLKWQDKQGQNARGAKGNDYESIFDDLLALFDAQQTERSQMLDGLLFSVGTEYASYLYNLDDRQGATRIAETISSPARFGWIAVDTPRWLSSASVRYGPRSIIRSHACAAFAGEYSMPTNFRPMYRATVPVVPDPRNGSSTRSPSLVHAPMTRPR
jgi:tetratricopeptide (TPR) repeat protein